MPQLDWASLPSLGSISEYLDFTQTDLSEGLGNSGPSADIEPNEKSFTPSACSPSNTLGSWLARSPKLWPSHEDTTGSCITQLSDLNARLYPVYRTSCCFGAAQQKYAGPLISAAAFDAVTTLLNGSTTITTQNLQKCNAMYELFNASRSLLDIIHRLQASTTSLAAAPRMLNRVRPLQGSADAATDAVINDSGRPGSPLSRPSLTPDPSALPSQTILPDTTDPGDGQAGPQFDRSFSFVRLDTAETGSHDVVMCHLISACYVRLLHIYGTLISALHHDAFRTKDNRSEVLPSPDEIRLVLLAQVIAHLVDRLQQATKAYFTQANGQCHADAAMGSELSPPTLQDANRADQNLISRLEDSVKENLEQLRTLLHG
ncbi:MAG: hypothetical protein M1822_002055 [Bathelium mastoideum]|nr:MAG: hypothetical protein M1822_002055 [Bathelium mastoideum]